MSQTKQCDCKYNTSFSLLIQNEKWITKESFLFKAKSRKKEKKKDNRFLPMHSGGLKLILQPFGQAPESSSQLSPLLHCPQLIMHDLP